MPNLEITKRGTWSVVVDMGDYSSSDDIDGKIISFDVRDIVEIQLAPDESHIDVYMNNVHGKGQWPVTYDSAYSGFEYFIVDKVNTITPTDQEDLFYKLTDLRG